MKKRLFSILICLCMTVTLLPVVSLSAGAAASEPDYSWYDAGGTDFVISSAAQLWGLANISNGTAEGISQNNFSSTTITLAADIDLGGAQWTPIGLTEPFHGTVYGGGHIISGLAIGTPDSRSTNQNNGLFGILRANVSNLRVETSGIYAGYSSSGAPTSGILAGTREIGHITGCSVEGTVSGLDNSYNGGIIGMNFSGLGRIVDCHASVTILGDNSSYNGGIAGYNNSTNSAVTIEDCSAAGSISGGSNSCNGGIAGYSTGPIETCASDCTVSGGTDSYNGGIAGQNTGSAAIINDSYSAGTSAGSTYTAGIAGVNDSSSSITACYWNSDTGLVAVAGGIGSTTATGMPLAEMQTQDFADALNSNVYLGAASPVHYFWIWEGESKTPVVSSIYHDGTGSGTADDPYVVTTEQQLRVMALYTNQISTYVSGFSGKYFRLGNDITLHGNWTPIGYATISNTTYAFRGTFDGAGYTISGLAIGTSETNSTYSYNGLFGYVYAGGTLKNITAASDDGIYGKAGSYNGVLAGESNGTILNCSTSGSAHGGMYDGGLVGSNFGTIRCSSACGSASGGMFSGGLAGWNNTTASILNCYAAGSASGSTSSGGLLGTNYGTMTGSYWNTDAAGSGIGANNNPTGASATGISLAGMQTQNFADTLNGAIMALPLNTQGYYWIWEGTGTTPIVSSSYHDGTGSGTVGDPYVIATENQLRVLALTVNGGTGFAGVSFELEHSIVLNGQWTPIGCNETNAFQGSFDGNWQTISNLAIGTYDSPADTIYNGLFGYVGGSGTVKGLTVTSSTGVYGGSDGYNGVFTGYNAGDLINCAATGTVEGGDGSSNGVLTGGSNGVIANCWSAGGVSGGANSFNGGLAGHNGGSISNAWVSATNVAGGTSSFSGGLVGKNDSTGSISGCCFYCTVPVSGIGQDVGGQSGNISSESLEDMRTDAFVALLNAYVYEHPTAGASAVPLSGWTRSDGENDGLPTLAASLRLTAPIGPVWDSTTPGKAMWTAVSNASGYRVQLYKNGTAQGGPVTGVTATDYDFSSAINSAGSGSYTFTVTALGSGGFYTDSAISAESATYTYTRTTSGGGSSQISYSAVMSGNSASKLAVTVDRTTGSAWAELSAKQGEPVPDGKSLVVTMPEIDDVTGYTLGIPVPDLSSDSGAGSLTLSTGFGSLTLPSNMLTGTDGASGTTAQFTVRTVDSSDLSDSAQAVVGDRPVVSLSLAVDGKQTNWNNPDTPVTVSIPYTPAESEDVNAIVIWYIDGDGNLNCVESGHYDPATGTVTFQTTHFSLYSVGYNKVAFSDVPDIAWYADAVSFLAAREITSGTTATTFSPNTTLTRGQFLTLVMRAYGFAPDDNSSDNFSDAGSTYYTGYLATAKRLGISNGVGDNKFAPEQAISRQQMFTLLYNTLKEINQLPEGDSGKSISDFTDGSSISSYAQEALDYFVKTGVVNGNNECLLPSATATRAQMAQILYNILGN